MKERIFLVMNDGTSSTLRIHGPWVYGKFNPPTVTVLLEPPKIMGWPGGDPQTSKIAIPLLATP